MKEIEHQDPPNANKNMAKAITQTFKPAGNDWQRPWTFEGMLERQGITQPK
jgi:hypothetical protein